MQTKTIIQDALLGLAIGDAVGVPVEFIPRSDLKMQPVTDMLGYGTHNQPPGTWSDDSSLAFCLAEMLCKGYDPDDLARRFINWKEYGYWTPHGKVFDIGIATGTAVLSLQAGTLPTEAGGIAESSNGNGSLMRILPLLFYINGMPIAQRFQYTKEISSLTHRHIRSIAACFIYLEFAQAMLQGLQPSAAYERVCTVAREFFIHHHILNTAEQQIFSRILNGLIPSLQESEIFSGGYVIHTLEASLWCILSTTNYKDAVLKAVNLGDDTDTTAAVTGGLAGLLYGWEAIPINWLNKLVKKEVIINLANRLHQKLANR
jgi:ADP-ribosylglycohydrolase